jgi:transposase
MTDLTMGIDVGNRQSVLYALSEEGEVILDSKKLGTLDEEAWRKVLEDLSGRFTVRACFEVGPHYEWLYDLLMEYCREVEVVNPADFALIWRSKKKTDKIDAKKLAEGLRRGDLPSVYVPAKAVRADRRLVSFVHKHSQDLSKLKSQIRALLTPHRLRCPFSDILGLRGLAWLQLEAMEKLEGQEKLFLEMLLNRAELMVAQRDELDALLGERLGKYEGARYLKTIPGFGPLTTLAVISSIDDIARFQKPSQLASYFGVCGAIYQSGQTIIQGPMTKRGNVHVRWLLSQALHHVHRKDPKARQRYKRLQRGKPKGVSRGAQTRWLTEIIWRLLTKGEPYRFTPSPHKECLPTGRKDEMSRKAA